MIFRVRIGKWRFTFTMARTQYVEGVNSELQDGNHILLWDFDDVSLNAVATTLKMIQNQWHLPNIYILNTGKECSFHAYCLKRYDWQTAARIVTNTVGVDWNFIKYGIFRGKFTLRVSPKGGRPVRGVAVLRSEVPEGVHLTELKSWVRYETLTDEEDVVMHELRLF